MASKPRHSAPHAPEPIKEAIEVLDTAGIGLRTGRILGRTLKAFFDDNASRLGAALAFYTTIAVAPLLVITMAVAGLVFEDDASARQQVISEIERLAGSQASTVIKSVGNPVSTATGTVATVIGFATLAFGAFNVFQHLQDALNSIWRVQIPPEKGWKKFVRRRIFSLATVIATGFLLLVSLVASAVLSWLGATTIKHFGFPVLMLQVMNNVLSFVVVTVLFALVFKLLPDTPIRWRHVWLGALVTALLFTAGKSVLGIYLGKAAVTSSYGAAGSLVALLLWCYYAAQIVFLGAEFTRVTSLSNGGRNFSPLTPLIERKRTV